MENHADQLWQDALELLGNETPPKTENAEEAVKLLEQAIKLDHGGACNSLSTLLLYGWGIEKDTHRAYELCLRALTLGYKNAKRHLSRFYEQGIEVEQDAEKAKQLLIEAAEADTTGNLYLELAGCGLQYSRFNMTPEEGLHWLEKSVECRNLQAIYNLSVLYSEGKYVNKDEEKAARLIYEYNDLARYMSTGVLPLNKVKEGARQGDPEALFQLGNRYRDGDGVNKNMNVASDYWMQAAMKGHVMATHSLGMFYTYGKHDIENGLKWLNKAAGKGCPLSFYELGYIYEKGQGVEIDAEKVMEYYTAAAKMNEARAQVRLSIIYHNGEFVEKDLDKSRYWLEQGANNGDWHAKYAMAQMYHTGELYDVDNLKSVNIFEELVKCRIYEAYYDYISILWNGDGIEADRERVVAVFTELADSGDPVAQFYLYTMYKSEDYTGHDIAKAKVELEKSASAGYDQAILYLGVEYLEGGMYPTDNVRAVELFAQASNMGNNVAMTNLAQSYQFGRGCEIDEHKALELYEQAAGLGNADAAREAAKLYLKSDSDCYDETKAIAVLEKSAEQDVESCFMLGYIYNYLNSQENHFSWENALKGFNCMKKAADAGHHEAIFRVAYSYLEGRGVIRDANKSREYFQKALDNNYRVDEVNEALNQYLTGNGVSDFYPQDIYLCDVAEKNPSLQNQKWTLLDEDGNIQIDNVFEAAAECGEVNASIRVGLDALSTDPDKAETCLAKAIKAGEIHLASILCKMYLYGNEKYNVEQDVERALHYVQYGMEADNLECAYLYALILLEWTEEDRHTILEAFEYVYSNSEEDSELEESSSYFIGLLKNEELKEGKQLCDIESAYYLSMLKFYGHNGNFDELEKVLDMIRLGFEVDELPADVPVMYAYIGRFNKAHEILDELRAVHPEDKNLIAKRGFCKAFAADFDGAYQDFVAGDIFESPDDTIIQEYCELLLAREKYDEVLDVTSRAKDLGVQTGELMIVRAMAFKGKGMLSEMTDDLNKAAECPVDTDNAMASAHALLLLGRVDECRKQIEYGVGILEDNYGFTVCFAYMEAAAYYATLGDETKTKEYFSKAAMTGYCLYDYLSKKEFAADLMKYPEVQEMINKK